MVDEGEGEARPEGAALESIREDQAGSARLAALEDVDDPCLFEEAREEVEIRLAILDLVFKLRVLRSIDAPCGWEVPLGEELVDDVGDGEVLVDAVSAPPGEEPEPRDDLEFVRREALFTGADVHGLCLRGVRHDAGPHPRPEAGGVGVPGDGVERRGAAEDGREGERRVG